jgi:hypothetical protein
VPRYGSLDGLTHRAFEGPKVVPWLLRFNPRRIHLRQACWAIRSHNHRPVFDCVFGKGHLRLPCCRRNSEGMKLDLTTLPLIDATRPMCRRAPLDSLLRLCQLERAVRAKALTWRLREQAVTSGLTPLLRLETLARSRGANPGGGSDDGRHASGLAADYLAASTTSWPKALQSSQTAEGRLNKTTRGRRGRPDS